ncbi:MAG: hypothetical protein ACOCXH_05015, partial [Cyclobacteriaceae bacterium]
THTTDGSDYQHAMTLIANQPDAAGEIQGAYLRNQMLPALYDNMDSLGYPMTPYVWPMKKTPDKGIRGFYDSPRYSSGYASLFQCLSFESEAHMLKPFGVRVNATLVFFEAMLQVMKAQHKTILETKKSALEKFIQADTYHTNWVMDTARHSMIDFMGYEPEYINSPVTNLPLLRYNQEKPYKKSIPYYEFFLPSKTINIPKAYIIPQAWDDVIERLAINGITYHTFEQDTSLEVSWYNISGYETYPRIYEGHYPHYQTEAEPVTGVMHFRAGDVWVDTRQEGIRFILEMLEPECVDSYFNWNFFDSVLEQKEYFGEYYFTLLAEEYLKKNPELAAKLRQKQQSDPAFAQNNRAQLQFIYENSPYQEPGFMRYPVYRVEE